MKSLTGCQTRGMEEKLNSRESNQEGTRPHIQDTHAKEEDMRITKHYGNGTIKVNLGRLGMHVKLKQRFFLKPLNCVIIKHNDL